MLLRTLYDGETDTSLQLSDKLSLIHLLLAQNSKFYYIPMANSDLQALMAAKNANEVKIKSSLRKPCSSRMPEVNSFMKIRRILHLVNTVLAANVLFLGNDIELNPGHVPEYQLNISKGLRFIDINIWTNFDCSATNTTYTFY